MPVLMPLVEMEAEEVRELRRPDDQETLNVSLGSVIAFGATGIRAGGETMEQAVLAAVDLYWEAEAGQGELGRLSRQDSGEIDAVMEPVRDDSAPLAPQRVDSVVLEPEVLEPVVLDSGALDSGALDSGALDSEVLDSGVLDSEVAEKEAHAVSRRELSEMDGRAQAASSESDAGFSESEEAFFDGYEPEEPLDQEELLAMFDPAQAWRQRRAASGRKRAQRPGGAKSKAKSKGKSKGHRKSGLRLLSLFG